ncbi:D-alanyl-D-alanine carboxypeptidase family protein [Streptomyces sp. NPDC049813]|uniref:D-alanyl-D-alanine carboxypeptidase family protein n=1 Tax=Streptomyces sp. NPDC049813 TaxID=3365597 RepID=UPI0037B8D44F
MAKRVGAGPGTSKARGAWRAWTASGLCAVAAVGVLAGPAPAAATAQAPPAVPSLSALAWEVMDADSGTVLAARAPHRRLPPASTLKTLFALTLLPKLRQDTVHQATHADLAQVAAGSSLVGVDEGSRYTVADLWRGVFLSSGNDAVHTLARMNGGLPRTLTQMQATAERIGARDTQVRSPDGFDTPGQFSSAHDLALIAREGFKNSDFRRYMGTKWARFPAAGGPKAFGIQNTNRLLVGSHGVRPYPGLIGVKNGYTSQAGTTLVTAATREGRTVLVTVMNPQKESFNAVYEEARALLDWGFAAKPPRAVHNAGPQQHLTAHKLVAATPVSSGTPDAGPGLTRHLGAAAALVVLSCIPLVIRRRLRGRRRPLA